MKKWVITLVVLVVIGIAALIVGPKIYASRYSSDKAAPSLSQAATATASAGNLDGNWTVAADSYAGYRVEKTIGAELVTVVGRTEGVTGTVEVDGDQLTAATIEVDMTTVTTDEAQRDEHFRGADLLDTAQYPTAKFEATGPVTISGTTATVPGTLTLKGVSAPVEATMDIAAMGDTLQVAGTVPMTWSDFGVTAPSRPGVMSVVETGDLEFLLNLSK